jgi:hypothetical protein
MKHEVSAGWVRRHHERHRLRMLGLALSLAMVTMAGEAQPICTQISATVTCSGTTTDQNAPEASGHPATSATPLT